MAGAMDYVRKTYHVPAKRGMWVRLNVPGRDYGLEGVIKSARHGNLRVWFYWLGKTNRSIVHPLDLDYRIQYEHAEYPGFDHEWWRPPQSRERIALKEMEIEAELWEGLEP